MNRKLKTSVEPLRANTKKEKVGNSHSTNQQLVSAPRYSIRQTGQYKRSAKRCMKRGCSMGKLAKVIDYLAGSGQLPPKYLKHSLGGLYKSHLECHISNDLLLVWKQDDDCLLITLVDIGTHSELFDKKRH